MNDFPYEIEINNDKIGEVITWCMDTIGKTEFMKTWSFHKFRFFNPNTTIFQFSHEADATYFQLVWK